MIVTQVHIVLGTIKGHSKMCSFVTQHNATNVSGFEERAIGMLPAGMSTRAVAIEFHVNFSTNDVLQNLAVHPIGLRTADHV